MGMAGPSRQNNHSSSAPRTVPRQPTASAPATTAEASWKLQSLDPFEEGNGSRRRPQSHHKVDRKKAKHRAEAIAASTGRGRGGAGRAGGRHAAQILEAASGMDHTLGLLGSSPKSKSAWMLEREQIMAEWGLFGVSGLMLAEDSDTDGSLFA